MNVNREAVERLSRYRSVLLRLQALGFAKVFSDNLGDALGVSGSQVRKDFAMFGVRGVKRGGFQISDLLGRIAEVLGTSGQLRTVVVGCGKIGTALVRMYGGRREGVTVVAGFDINPKLLAPQAEVPVFDMRELPAFLQAQVIQVAILCTPEEVAPGILDQLRQSGVVRGVLNFTPSPLRSDAQCIVQNIDIRMEIEKLFCLIHLMGSAGVKSK
jgi:redox-sensing transcriptional repressor